MSRLRKANCRDIRVLFGKDGVSYRAAETMIEGLQGKRALIPRAMDYVPASTRRWLSGLSDEEKARLSIISNPTADVIYCQSNMWKNFEKAGDIVTRTMVAYPGANERMPARLEYTSMAKNRQTIIRVIDTRDFRDIPNIAIAFDRCEVEWETSKAGIIERIRPRGEIVVLEDFPQRIDSYETSEHSILGYPGERYVHRIEGPWIGHIVRTCLGGHCTPPKESIFVCYEPSKLFGILVELPREELKRGKNEHTPLCYEPTEEILLPGRVGETEAPKPKKLDLQARTRLRQKIAERVAHYFKNLGDLDAPAPEHEMGEEFEGVAAGNRQMQDELRELVRISVSMEFERQDSLIAYGIESTRFQILPAHLIRKPTLDEIRKTSDRISRALGIPA